MSAELATLLGTMITTLGGIFVLWLTQQAAARKVAEARQSDREDDKQAALDRATALAKQVTDSAATLSKKVEGTASVLADKVAETAVALSGTVTDAAAVLSDRVANDADRKSVQLNEIHVLVNSRLSRAMNEIAELKKLALQLIEKVPAENKALRNRALKKAAPSKMPPADSWRAKTVAQIVDDDPPPLRIPRRPKKKP